MNEKLKPVSTKISAEELAELTLLAEKEQRPVSRQIRVAIRRMLEDAKRGVAA